MSSDKLLRPDQLVQLQEIPNDIDFRCPGCGLNCKTFPKTRAVVHQKPECSMWHKAAKNKDELALFLIKGGVELAFAAKA